MSMVVHQSAVTGRYDEVLVDGLERAAEWSLWIQPEGANRFDAGDLARLSEAFGERRPICWHTGGTGSISERIRDRKRALGNWPALSKGVVAQVTIEYTDPSDRVYADVAWVSPESYADLSNLVWRSRVGRNSALAFIPNRVEAARQWAQSVLGLVWAQLCRGWMTSTKDPPLDVIAATLSYVRLTTDLGGVASLSWTSDAWRGLVFLGSAAILEPVAALLATAGESSDQAVFDRWMGHGLYLDFASW